MFLKTSSMKSAIFGNDGGMQGVLCKNIFFYLTMEVLCLRWNEQHLSVYFRTLTTQ